MHRRKKTLGLIALLGVFSIIAAACGGGKTNTGATPSTAVGGKAGGVYRTAIEDFGFTGAFDPTGEYLGTAWGLYSDMLLRTLMTYKHIAGVPGDALAPDIASANPDVSAGGLTHTFHLKSVVMFAPPLD